MSTTKTREIVMTQEQLMKVKIKYLEDRIDTLERSIGRINVIMHKFQIKENLDKEQGFKESNDPFIKVMEQGEKDYELI